MNIVGVVRAEKLTAEECSEIARKAVATRWNPAPIRYRCLGRFKPGED